MKEVIRLNDLGIVMPVYKQNPAFLRAALHSVRNQTFKNYTMVIVIDGAPEMEPLINTLVDGDPRVQVISYAQNAGVASALNTGFKKLYRDNQIKYLTWVSSDNVYYPQFLEILRDALVKGSEELGLVYSSFQSIDNDDKPINNENQLALNRQYQAQPVQKLLDSSIVGVSFMYKSQYAKLIDGYSLPPVEDYDYWLRLSEHCDMKYIPVELIDYRVNSTFSVSATLHSELEHRRWRYTYHLARHLARTRRGIQPQLTILYSLSVADETTIARIENVYEQTFSNYLCYILDLSISQQVIGILAAISHPLTDFKWFPHASDNAALLYATQMVQTPYTMVLGSEQFLDVADLGVLIHVLSKASTMIISTHYTDDHLIGYRSKDTPVTVPAMNNELFRTPDLIELLKLRFT